jgi:hypothetical protein
MNSIMKAEWQHYARVSLDTYIQFVNEEIFPKFTLNKCNFDWSPSRRSSRGGWYADGPGINMAMHHYCRNYTKPTLIRVYEYKSFDNSSVIGGFYTKDKYQKLEMVLLHELSHAVQYYTYKVNNIRCKPHGPVWKNIYSRLREQFLNPCLGDQVALKTEYNKDIDSLGRNSKSTIPLATKKELDKLFARAANKS